MNFCLTIILTILAYPAIISGSPKRAIESVDCIETLEDFEQYKWRWNLVIGEGAEFRYAETGYELPGGVHNQINGNGIFYTSQNQMIPDQMIWKPNGELIDSLPIYVYIRYYIHMLDALGTESSCIRPVENPTSDKCPDGFELQPTSNFQWAETFVKMNFQQAFETVGLRLAALRYKGGDYFLLDRIIVTQGLEISNIQEIRDLCSWTGPTEDPSTNTTVTTSEPVTDETTITTSEPVTDETTVTTSEPVTDETTVTTSEPVTDETTVTTSEPVTDDTTVTTNEPVTDDTTTTSTEIPPTDSTPPPSGFQCESVGSFADPDDCQKFHVCQHDNSGGWWDTPFTCPETTVWCQRTLECELPVTCPCEL